MMIEGDAKRVTVFMGESDRWHHQTLHTAMVEMLRREGCAGATVLKGVEGFGKDSRIHTAHVLRLSEDLPVVLIFIDTPERVERVLPKIEEMLGGGLIVVEDVNVLRYTDSSES
jgi:hypothetical protein